MINLIRHYGLPGFMRLLLDKIFTYLISSNAKIIRRPFEIRGKKNIIIGKGFTTGRYCRIEAYSEGADCVLTIGNNCQINDSVHIAAAQSIVLGDDVLIASRVFITDLNHGSYSGEIQTSPREIASLRKLITAPVNIKNNVWLGEGVVVLPGVTIGDNAIIGANSVVTKDIPPNSIAVGNPAKVIKKYNFETEKWN